MDYKTHIGIIGGGIAGLVASFYALNNGYKVTLFEDNLVGGKAFNGGDLYLNNFFEEIKLNINNTRQKLNSLFINYDSNKKNILTTYFPFLKNNEDFTLIPFKAKIVGTNSVAANNFTYNFNYIIIASGSNHNIPSITGLASSLEKGYSLLSTDLNKLSKDAKKVGIIGSGRVAFELAMILIEFEVEVHLFARGNLLSGLDNEVKNVFINSIKNDNLNFHLNTDFHFVDKNTLYYNQTKASFDYLIVASGFTANNVIAENTNIKTSDEGIIINDFLQTNISNIYAIGDVNTSPKFSKTATKEALIAINHIKGVRNSYKDNFFFNILGKYEYAYYGYTEEKLIKDNIEYIKITINSDEIVNNYEAIKYVKVLVKKTSREILGLFVIAKNASSVMNSLFLLLQESVENLVTGRLTLFTNIHFVVLLINEELKKIDFEIINNYYEPFYQIKIAKNNKIIGAESLARFKHNDSFLSPLPFIENFEKNGLILDLDLKTIENACLLLMDLNNENLIDESFQISINLSSLSIYMLEYTKIDKIFKKYNTNPKQIIFEITERKTVEDNSYKKLLNKFKSLGFLLSMDDFSVGNSSLNLYHDVNFDEVKLDMELLPNSENDYIKISVYENLVKMLREKDVSINSEGIENEFHFSFTKSLDIDSYQGYHFSKPLPKEDFIKLLKTNLK